MAMSDTTVYMFSSPTCGPCKHIKPVINELKEDYSHLKWVDVDTSVDTQTAMRFGVRQVPTMVIATPSAVIGSFTGTQAMGYLTLLKKVKSQ